MTRYASYAFLPPSSATSASLLALLLLTAMSGCTGKRFDALSDAGPSEAPSATLGGPSSSAEPPPAILPDAATDPATAGTTSSTADASVGDASAAPPSGSTATNQPPLEEAGTSSSVPSTGPAETATDDALEPVEAGAPEFTFDDAAAGGTDTAPTEASGDSGACDVASGCGELPDASLLDASAEAGPGPDSSVDPSDECPKFAEQSERGSCGCGFAPDDACSALEAALIHRYGFEGSGAAAVDSVGEADGELTGAELDGSGYVSLAGEDAYVTLPEGILTEATNASLEVWLIWNGGDDWQRVFDFGNRSGGTFGPPEPRTYLYLTPRSGSASGSQALMVAYTLNGSGSTVHLHADDALPIAELSQVVVVVNASDNRLSLYLNGALMDDASFSPALNDITDATNRLGRSLFDEDPYLDADLYDFRIYGAALSDEQIAKSFELGPDATFSAPPLDE